jgi:hypothetical protein
MDLNLGLKPEGAYAMTADVRAEAYDAARSLRFRHELLSRARNLPGIKAAGILNTLPLNLAGLESDFFMHVGAPIPGVETRQVTLVYNVTAGYFQAGTLTEQLALPLFPAGGGDDAGTLGNLALVLSATGLFSLVAFAVSRRAREIGIRIALGQLRRRIP